MDITCVYCNKKLKKYSGYNLEAIKAHYKRSVIWVGVDVGLARCFNAPVEPDSTRWHEPRKDNAVISGVIYV